MMCVALGGTAVTFTLFSFLLFSLTRGRQEASETGCFCVFIQLFWPINDCVRKQTAQVPIKLLSVQIGSHIQICVKNRKRGLVSFFSGV